MVTLKVQSPYTCHGLSSLVLFVKLVSSECQKHLLNCKYMPDIICIKMRPHSWSCRNWLRPGKILHDTNIDPKIRWCFDAIRKQAIVITTEGLIFNGLAFYFVSLCKLWHRRRASKFMFSSRPLHLQVHTLAKFWQWCWALKLLTMHCNDVTWTSFSLKSQVIRLFV